ncbi:MAG: hypothetical protein R3F59_15435 [Myxococcota bacterium]
MTVLPPAAGSCRTIASRAPGTRQVRSRLSAVGVEPPARQHLLEIGVADRDLRGERPRELVALHQHAILARALERPR